MVDEAHPHLSLVRQCQLLGINRSSLYYRPVAPSEEELTLFRLLDQQYLKTPFYGSRRMMEHLRQQGYQVNRKRVRRLMHQLGLQAIYPKPKLSKAHPEHKIYPYLLREVEIVCVNQVWSTDITYLPVLKGISIWWRLWTGIAVRCGVRNRGGLEPANEEGTAAKQLQKLYQLLIEPIADILPQNAPKQRVIFIPHGKLFLVPFPAIIDDNGNYLIEQHTILTAPSIQVLDLAQKQRLALDYSQNLNPDQLLFVGNPAMPKVWDPSASDFRQLANLPGAEQEALAIANFLDSQPLLNATATEQQIKQQIETVRVIHFATHGLLEYGRPEDSGFNDVPGAIALAPGQGEDGLLTSAEIGDLNLQAELVVLSACDTGRGDITGDGVIGLSRSLFEAGVPSVIVSLWSVPDAPTADLMTEFYRQWRSGLDKAQALRQAMLATMATHPEPRDWAAFTLIGEAQ